MLLPQSPHPLSPLLCPQSSFYICVSIPALQNMFISTVSRFHIYSLIDNIIYFEMNYLAKWLLDSETKLMSLDRVSLHYFSHQSSSWLPSQSQFSIKIIYQQFSFYKFQGVKQLGKCSCFFSSSPKKHLFDSQ